MTTADVLRTGSLGLRTRRLRAALSALGIAIGIAAIVGILGITRSSEANLLAQIDRLGTNLLTVVAGTGTYSTEHSVHLTSSAHELGADAFLVVTPYYSKPNVEGIVRHFEAERGENAPAWRRILEQTTSALLRQSAGD